MLPKTVALEMELLLQVLAGGCALVSISPTLCTTQAQPAAVCGGANSPVNQRLQEPTGACEPQPPPLPRRLTPLCTQSLALR